MGIITATITALVATLFTTEYTGKAGFMVWICLIYLAFSGITAILPTTLAKLFGTSNMAVSYGFIQVALVCSSPRPRSISANLQQMVLLRNNENYPNRVIEGPPYLVSGSCPFNRLRLR